MRACLCKLRRPTWQPQAQVCSENEKRLLSTAALVAVLGVALARLHALRADDPVDEVGPRSEELVACLALKPHSLGRNVRIKSAGFPEPQMR